MILLLGEVNIQKFVDHRSPEPPFHSLHALINVFIVLLCLLIHVMPIIYASLLGRLFSAFLWSSGFQYDVVRVNFICVLFSHFVQETLQQSFSDSVLFDSLFLAPFFKPCYFQHHSNFTPTTVGECLSLIIKQVSFIKCLNLLWENA